MRPHQYWADSLIEGPRQIPLDDLDSRPLKPADQQLAFHANHPRGKIYIG